MNLCAFVSEVFLQLFTGSSGPGTTSFGISCPLGKTSTYVHYYTVHLKENKEKKVWFYIDAPLGLSELIQICFVSTLSIKKTYF